MENPNLNEASKVAEKAYKEGRKDAISAIIASRVRHKADNDYKAEDEDLTRKLKLKKLRDDLSIEKVKRLENVVKAADKSEDMISIDIHDDPGHTKSITADFVDDGHMSLHTIKGESSLLDKDRKGRQQSTGYGENDKFIKDTTGKDLKQVVDLNYERAKRKYNIREDLAILDEKSHWDTILTSTRFNGFEKKVKDGVEIKFMDASKEVGHAEVCDDYYGDKLSFLHNLEVKKEFRGKGYGSKIMEYLIKEYDIKYLNVDPKNEAAVNLYKKFGFEKIEKVKMDNGKVIDRMEREVDLKEEALTESIFSQDNLEINFEKWKDGTTGPLYITGLSGGGKTTLTEKLSDELNVPFIELDFITATIYSGREWALKKLNKFYRVDTEFNKLIRKFIESMPDEYFGKFERKDEKLYQLADKVALDFCRYLEESFNRKYIVEGVHIFHEMDNFFTPDKSYIIIGTGLITANLRAIKRAWGKHIDLKKKIKLTSYRLFDIINPNSPNHKQSVAIDNFKKTLTEEGDFMDELELEILQEMFGSDFDEEVLTESYDNEKFFNFRGHEYRADRSPVRAYGYFSFLNKSDCDKTWKKYRDYNVLFTTYRWDKKDDIRVIAKRDNPLDIVLITIDSKETHIKSIQNLTNDRDARLFIENNMKKPVQKIKINGRIFYYLNKEVSLVSNSGPALGVLNSAKGISDEIYKKMKMGSVVAVNNDGYPLIKSGTEYFTFEHDPIRFKKIQSTSLQECDETLTEATKFKRNGVDWEYVKPYKLGKTSLFRIDSKYYDWYVVAESYWGTGDVLIAEKPGEPAKYHLLHDDIKDMIPVRNVQWPTNEVLKEDIETLTEGQNSEYKKYIKEHISNVQKGYRWLKKHLPELFEDRKFTEKIGDYLTIKRHDRSKYNKKDELNAYQKHFYGKPEEKEANRPNFDHAWNHHQKINKHHWQYWVLVRGDGSHKTLDMPYRYIIEMICDWWSFSWRDGRLDEIFNWYNKNKSGMILSQNTRHTLEMILGKMKKKLQELEGEKKDLKESLEVKKEHDRKTLNDNLTEGMIQTIKDKFNSRKIEEIKPAIKKSLDDDLRILESKKTAVNQILHNILDDYDNQQNDMIAELSEKLESSLILQSITPAISKQSVLKNIKNHTKFFRFVYFKSDIKNPEDYIIFDTKKVWCFKNIKSNGELSSLIRPSQQKMKEYSWLISEINKGLEYSNMTKEWFDSLPEHYKSAIRAGFLTPSEVKEKMRKEFLKKLSLRESEFHDDLQAIYGNKLNVQEEGKEDIQDVVDQVKNIVYGFINKQNGERVEDRDWIHNCSNLGDYYDTNFDPEITLKNKLGICLDQSLAIKHLMNKLHPDYKCDIYALTKGRFGHAVPCYCEPEGKWYYFENAWDKERGLHGPFNDEEHMKQYLDMIYHKHHDADNDDPVVVQTYREFTERN